VSETRIVSGIAPCERSPRQVEREFRGLVERGVAIRCAGAGRRDPRRFLAGYTPKFKVELFEATFYLTKLREDVNFRFFVAFVLVPPRRALHPRIFYKDSSLVWRSPTHYVESERDNWIGKGDLKPVLVGDEEVLYSAEETTNLPLEIQGALDVLSRRGESVRRDERALGLVLRLGPDDRVEPYADFLGPRRRAQAKRRNLIHGGRPVAWFERERDPESLRFAAGFEPDFAGGVLEVTHSKSRLYGGDVHKFRILSTNRQIQYQFAAAPRHVWIVPPQALTTEIMSYGVRTIDVEVAEDLCVPGYEYHYLDDSEDPPFFYSQIPEGFAGPPSDVDPARADASPWLERLPVIQEFRKRVKLP
jgi:hypothetical protein